VASIEEKNPVSAILSTDINKSELNKETAKKKNLARVLKSIGDICLLAGSSRVALKIYSQACDVAKLNSESLWVALSLEGCSCTQYLIDIKEQGTKLLYSGELLEKYKEIISAYEKNGMTMLAIESCFKIANYLLKYQRKPTATDMLNEGLRISNIKRLTDEDKLRLLASLAALFKKIGFSRKYSFFLGLLAAKSTEQGKGHLGLMLLTKSLKFYGIHSYESFVSDVPPRNLRLVDWPHIHVHSLNTMIKLSETTKDDNKLIFYSNYLLARMYKHLDKDTQLLLINKLTKAAQKKESLEGSFTTF